MPSQRDDLLPDLTSALEHLISTQMVEQNIVGLSLAWVQPTANTGKPHVAWQRTFGHTNATTRDPVTSDTVFQAASLSKPIFAYAVIKACAEGLLDLDAPLSEHLSEPYIAGDPRLRWITARRILSHTSGLPNWRPKDRPLRIHFSAGDRFAYSGEGYVYLQRVVERLSGQSLDLWMRQRLFDPLGLQLTSYTWLDTYERLAAHGHDAQGKPNELARMKEPNAAYSLYTTPTEYAHLVIPLLDPPPDSATLLAPKRIAYMLSPKIPVNNAGLDASRPRAHVRTSKDVSWGLGWGLQHTPNRTFWHWGDNGDFQAFVMGNPKERTALVCMSNSQNGNELWSSIFSVAFDGPQPAIDWLESL